MLASILEIILMSFLQSFVASVNVNAQTYTGEQH